MRNPLFRGIPKRKSNFGFYKRAHPFPGNTYDGGFALGSLLVDDYTDRAFICCALVAEINCAVGNAQCSAIEIDSDTVGQYIGLDDKYEKHIFEGDFLSVECEDTYREDETTIWHEIARVVWSEELYGWCALFGDGDLVHMDELDDGRSLEVLGNIYENPELLEEMKR